MRSTAVCDKSSRGFCCALFGLATLAAASMPCQAEQQDRRQADVTGGYASTHIVVEFTPQGTLAERIRAGGAGIPAFFTKTGVGTMVADGKEIREFDGAQYVMERGLFADVAIVHAWKGDTEGNLIYRKTARNFNPMMATAAETTVAEVEHLVEPGELDPDQIMTPGIFVDRIIHYPNASKHIEQRTTGPRGT